MSWRTTTSTATVVVAVVVAAVATGGVAVAQLTPDAPADDGGSQLAVQNMTQNESVQIRTVHASPDAPAVDVFFDGAPVLSDVSFGTVGDYLETTPGEHSFRVTVAGNESAVVFDDNVTLEADQRYTAVALGEVSEEAPTSFNVTLFEDATVVPPEDNATVRLLHLSPDAPAVDVVVNDTDTVLFENASFGNATDYEEVPAGEYTLDVRPAGENTTVATFDVSLEGGTAYSVFAVGYLDTEAAAGDEPFDLVAAVDLTEEMMDGEPTETPAVGTETPTEGGNVTAGGGPDY